MSDELHYNYINVLVLERFLLEAARGLAIGTWFFQCCLREWIHGLNRNTCKFWDGLYFPSFKCYTIKWQVIDLREPCTFLFLGSILEHLSLENFFDNSVWRINFDSFGQFSAWNVETRIDVRVFLPWDCEAQLKQQILKTKNWKFCDSSQLV